MTDIELLPLPNWLLVGFTDPTIEWLTDYARANVEHHTAAKDAEIEALRAEVDEARGLVTEANNSLYGSQAYFHSLDGGPYNKHHLANGIEDLKGRARAGHAAEARAERLAEALRELVALGHPRDPAIIAASAALSDHDQEGKDG